jgi:hypothetical protein
MTITQAPPAPPDGQPCAGSHPARFRDAHAVLDIAETPGLPFPQISSTQAAFHFTNITHARDAREAVALAETVLSYALNVEFAPRPVPRAGSSAHYILSAYMASGLRVDIVAKAGIFDDAASAASPREPELAVAAA